MGLGRVVVSLIQKSARLSPLCQPTPGITMLRMDVSLAQCSQFTDDEVRPRKINLIFLVAYMQLYRQYSHPDFLFQSCAKHLDHCL